MHCQQRSQSSSMFTTHAVSDSRRILRYFDGGHFVLDEFADACRGDPRDAHSLGAADHDRVLHCANSYEGIDPYHRLIDSSPWFWLNRIYIRKQPRASLQFGRLRK